jgi:hypothetical protein
MIRRFVLDQCRLPPPRHTLQGSGVAQGPAARRRAAGTLTRNAPVAASCTMPGSPSAGSTTSPDASTALMQPPRLLHSTCMHGTGIAHVVSFMPSSSPASAVRGARLCASLACCAQHAAPPGHAARSACMSPTATTNLQCIPLPPFVEVLLEGLLLILPDLGQLHVETALHQHTRSLSL